MMQTHTMMTTQEVIDFRSFDLISAIVLMLNKEGVVTAANYYAGNALATSVENMIGKDWFACFIPSEEQTLVRTVFEKILSDELATVEHFENHVVTLSGEKRLISWRNTWIRSEHGQITRVLSVGEDITDKRKQETQLSLAASVFTHAQEGITIADAQGIIQDVNEGFVRLTGYSKAEVIGKSPKLLQSGKHDARFYQEMWQSLKDKGNWDGEVINRRKDGSLWAEQLTIKAVRDSQQQVSHYLAFFTDITAIKENQNRITSLAFHDALTQLPNRTLFAERLTQAMKQSLVKHHLLAVCYLDLDGFKPINDQFGHEHGDRVLIAIANKLQQLIRPSDTVARLGGDEFVLLLTNHESVEGITGHLTDIILALNKPCNINNQEHHITASIGVAVYPNDSVNVDTLLRHADHAMYQAKRDGRNRYHLFDQEKDLQAQKQRNQVERFTQAIETNELRLYFQPKVNMHTGEVLGAEALVRWKHPEQGILPPGAFLPFIEHSEVMPFLDRWVVHNALKQLSSWKAQQNATVHISINISAATLQDKGFTHYLQQQFALFDTVLPAQVELEVLESSALHDLSAAAHVIDTCHQLGVSFALDDFGTGYSSLTYLRRLSANTLKIDQSFVRDMLSDSEDLAIVQGVIALAHAFELKVVAEGVETAAHGAMLLRLGSPIAQGYGIARPMPADDLLHWISIFKPSPLWQSITPLVLMSHDLPLITAEIDHHTWIDKLINFLNGTDQRLPAGLDAHHCRFGRWYDHEGQQSYGKLPEFQAIAAVHEKLHDTADIFLQKHAAKAGGAIEHIPELMQLRYEMLDALHKLQLAVSAGNQTALKQ